MEEYRFLFPYERVPKGSRIVIYGAGDVGINYLKQLMITHYCEVICFFDRAYDQYPAMIIPVLAPEQIDKIVFDYIVIALKSKSYLNSICDFLHYKGIEDERIVYLGIRSTYCEIFIKGDETIERGLAHEKSNGISVALRYGHGIGDAIIHKKFVEDMMKYPALM